MHRHTLGGRIDTLMLEALEALTAAAFMSKEEKIPFVRMALHKTDTLQVLLMALWESKSLDTKKYIALSSQFDEVGKMTRGWYGQLTKQNSPQV